MELCCVSHWESAFYYFTVSKFTQNNSLCLSSYIVSQNMFLLNTCKVFSKFYCMGWFQESVNTFEILVQFSFNINVFFKKISGLCFSQLAGTLRGSWTECQSVFVHISDTEHHLMLFQCTQTRHRVDFVTVLEQDSKCVKIEKISWFIKHWHSTFINILK